MSANMHLYLIRHGESVNNRLGGEGLSFEEYMARRSPDPDLTEAGRRQAQLVARHLAEAEHLENQTSGPGYGIQQLYASAMHRALLTTRPIAAALNVPVEVNTDIYEHGGMFHGHPNTDDVVSFPGLTQAEMSAGFPGYLLPQTISETGWYDGGYESMEMCDVRAQAVATWLRAMAEEQAEGKVKTIGFVSHATFIDRLLKALMGMPGSNDFYFYHYNTAISRVDFLDDGRRILAFTNRTLHLPPELLTY